MTDIRTRLADVIRDYPQSRWEGDPYTCEEIADVLLSLPGIAIVELPTVNVWDLSEISFGVNPMTPGLARNIAAALLAAANAAEAGA